MIFLFFFKWKCIQYILSQFPLSHLLTSPAYLSIDPALCLPSLSLGNKQANKTQTNIPELKEITSKKAQEIIELLCCYWGSYIYWISISYQVVCKHFLPFCSCFWTLPIISLAVLKFFFNKFSFVYFCISCLCFEVSYS